MKATKHYEDGAVVVFFYEDNNTERPFDCVMAFDNEQQMARLGECLKDLARTGGTTVSIGEKK